jgi:undecaprenyl-diphosphatase
MPLQPIVAPPWRRAAVLAVVAAAVMVAAFGIALHDVRSTVAFDRWTARPLFDYVGEGGKNFMVGLSTPAIPLILLAALAVGAALLRRWNVVALSIVGPTAALGLTEYVLKPAVHRTLVLNSVDAGYAYPSGHETGLVSLLVVLLLLLPRLRLSRPTTVATASLLAVWAVLGALGLVRAHYHYMSDTVGGIGIAVVCVLGSALVIDFGTGMLTRRVHTGAGAGQLT